MPPPLSPPRRGAALAILADRLGTEPLLLLQVIRLASTGALGAMALGRIAHTCTLLYLPFTLVDTAAGGGGSGSLLSVLSPSIPASPASPPAPPPASPPTSSIASVPSAYSAFTGARTATATATATASGILQLRLGRLLYRFPSI